MNEPQRIDEDFAVAGHLVEADFPELARQGVRTLVCLRPDEEEGDFISSDEAARLAEANDMLLRFAPVQGLDVTDEALAAVEAALDAPGAVVGYCRSGRRVALTWALVQARRGRPVPEILERCRAAGHDLDAMTEQLEAAAAGTGRA